MISRRQIVVVSLLAGLLAIGSFYFFQPEYGDSYSERRRQFTNEYLADRVLSVRESPSEEIERENTHWTVDVWGSKNISQLPIEGLSRMELLQRADNNSDACLLLANFGDYGGDPRLYSIYYMKRDWYEKAKLLNRPGAEFLLDVFEYYEQKLPDMPSGSLYGSASLREPRDMRAIRSLASYADFRKAMEGGDYRLAKALFIIDPHFILCKEVEFLRQALEEKAQNGDHDALIGLVQMFFEQGYYDKILSYEIESEKQKSIDPFMRWIVKQFDIEGYSGKSHTFDRLHDLMEQLGEVADEGDLNAMYVWIKYAPSLAQRHYDKKTWERFFQYSDRLLECGYIPWIRDMAAGFEIPYTLFFCYYSYESIESVILRTRSLLAERGEYGSIFSYIRMFRTLVKNNILEIFQYNVVDNLSLQKTPESVDDSEQLVRRNVLVFMRKTEKIRPSYMYEWSTYKLLLEGSADDELGLYIVERLKQGALAGDPEAKSFLASVIMAGHVPDMGKSEACKLLEEASESYFRQAPYYIDFPHGSISFADHVANLLMHLYVESEDEKDHQKAFELAKRFYDEGLDGHSKLKYYFLGYVYEKGIGTDIDYAKAAECYRKGWGEPRDANCWRALARIYEQGLGVEKDLAMAMKYYRAVFDRLPDTEMGFETANPEEEFNRLEELLEKEVNQ